MSLRAAGIEVFGDEVALLELPEPAALEAGQVLIDVKAAGVASWDEFVRTGGWDVGRVPPLALGVEAAGEVVGVGPGVEWPAAGAPVMTHPLPLPYQGCWAERLVAPARLVAEKPDNASWAEAGAFPVPALTSAEHGRDDAGLEIDAANHVVFRVGHVKVVAGIREPFWAPEPGKAGRPTVARKSAVAGTGDGGDDSG